LEDEELERLRRKKLLQMKRLLEKRRRVEERSVHVKTPSPREMLNRYLVGRAREVMDAARAQYPSLASYVERALAKMIIEGRLKEKITGEELYGLFYRLGARIKLRTRIKIIENGRVKSIHEKIREGFS